MLAGSVRSYRKDVLYPLAALQSFELHNYGALTKDPARYPLIAVVSTDWSSERASILITGGVHGDETSGVHATLRFLQDALASGYTDLFNIVAVPVVCPWGYETGTRWSVSTSDDAEERMCLGFPSEFAHVVDPNRSFRPAALEGPCEETAALCGFLDGLSMRGRRIDCHLDLHEYSPPYATDGDSGYFIIGDAERPQPAWYDAMIRAVLPVTPVATVHPAAVEPASVWEAWRAFNHDGEMYISYKDVALESAGVVCLYDPKAYGYCVGVTQAELTATIEACAAAGFETCVAAHVAAIHGALDYLGSAKGIR